MTLPPGPRKLALSLHIASSVGWLGAVVVFLVLAVIAVTNTNQQTVRGVYLVMEPAAWATLVPLALATLVTGVVQSLGTPWGLVRHYWVLFKLAITLVWTVVLLSYLSTFAYLADVAGDPRADLAVVASPSPAIHGDAALVGLLAALALSVFKPQGMTRYGRRKQQQERRRRTRPVPEQPALPQP